MRRAPRKYKKAITRILNGVKRGNKGRMDELFKMTFNHFYGLARVRLWDKSKAEDAVMSMYESVIKYIDSFDVGKDGYSWMYTIISRIIYNLNAEAITTVRYEQLATDDTNLAKDINEMYDALGLSEGVAYMDDIDKSIVYMYYFEQRTLEETAAALNLSTSAVHKRKQQILKSLKKFLS